MLPPQTPRLLPLYQPLPRGYARSLQSSLRAMLSTLHSGLLRDAPTGAFSTGVLWDRAIAEGRLYGISHSGLWFEVGAPQMIAPTEAALQRG